MFSFACKRNGLALAFVWSVYCSNSSSHAEELRIPSCIVSIIEDVTFAAQEDGLLREIAVQAGSVVKPKDLIAKLDDRQAVVERDVAQVKTVIAAKKADNDVEARLARAEQRVKQFEHDQAVQANKIVSKVVGPVELKKLALGIEEASLKAEKAERDLEVLVEEKGVAALELDAAKLAVERRTVTSSLHGVVVQRFVDVGEWVKVGDPICRAIRLDKVWVEGLLEARANTSGQVTGKHVTVLLEVPGGTTESFAGLVVFVDPQIDGNGRFLVRAEVTNKLRDGQWSILPGRVAEMVIAPPKKD